MKQKTKFLTNPRAAAVLSAALLLFAFAACNDPGEGAYVMGSDAVLYSLTIGKSAATEMTALAPSPIDSKDFEDPDVEIAGEDAMLINLKVDDDTVSVYLRPSASKNARVAWGVGDQVNRPPEFHDYRVPANFNNEDYIYIRVISEDTKRTNYYRFYVFMLKRSTDLAEIIVDNRKAEKEAAAGSWDFIHLNAGLLDITIPGAVNAPIEAIGFETTSTFRFAKVPNGSPAVPSFSPANVMTFTDLDVLYVEVTGENGIDRAYYKFVVCVGRIANLAKLSFGGLKVGETVNENAVTEVTSRGFPNAEWDKVSPGSFSHADMPDTGFRIIIEKDDPGSKVFYKLVDERDTINSEPMPGTWTEIPSTGLISGTSLAKVPFTNNDWLAIKVESQGGEKTRHTVYYETMVDKDNKPVLDGNRNPIMIRVEGDKVEGVRYYKIAVELLAANFKKHPVSTVYHYYRNPTEAAAANTLAGATVDYPSPRSFTSDTPEALKVELDRDVPGATYQWYESNSWYGGYGFDVDGRKCYMVGNNMIVEAGFIEDEFHAKQFDEKLSYSTLFNGGNQAARYVVPGKKIDTNAGRQPTYTPTIADKRPFISVFSYETHYYWVEVTLPNGRKATSGRAVIVTERNPDRQHLVIDVNNGYTTGGANPMPLKFRNPVVFKERYDKFRIPIEGILGSSFVQTNWKILTAQARFYLSDGREWIQNWTNGNLSFEDNSVDYVVDGVHSGGKIPEWYPLNPYGLPPTEADIETYGVEVLKKAPGCGAGYGGRILGLFYNLTNNNATYDITSDVKEDGNGGSLHEDGKITHVVIEPSGDHTKGPNKDGYPKLNAEGKADDSIISIYPREDGDLQGWFCGYVELVELIFQGPR
jgi:hypothetical protein